MTRTQDIARGNHVVPTEWAEELEDAVNTWKSRCEKAEAQLSNSDLYKELQKVAAERDYLKNYIRETGDVFDICTYDVLNEICSNCQCGKDKE